MHEKTTNIHQISVQKASGRGREAWAHLVGLADHTWHHLMPLPPLPRHQFVGKQGNTPRSLLRP
jgi:hypothetical protein